MSCDSCNYGLGNTGSGNCKTLASAAKKVIFREYFTDAGLVNGIDITSAPTLNKAAIDALKASLTATKIFPTPGVCQNMTDERADSTFETFDSGQKEFVHIGERTFSCIFTKGSLELVAFLESLRCRTMGMYVVDSDSSLVGNVAVSTMFAPLRLDTATIEVKYVKHDGKVGGKVMFSCQYAQSEKDTDLGVIPYTPTETTGLTYDLLTCEGLIDAYSTAGMTSITTTGFTIALGYKTGHAYTLSPWKSAAAADFKLTNAASGATIAITSVTESTVTPGTYVFVVASTVSGQSYHLRQSATNYGWDLRNIADGLVP